MRSVSTWAAFIVLSACCVALLDAAGFAGAGLLGPMAIGILFATRGHALTIAPPAFWWAQGIVGLLIARSVPASVVIEMSRGWPLLVGSTIAVVGASSAIGYLLARNRVLPGTTAIWGFFPGGASAMTVMAEEFGADLRMVALIQYLRVVLVTVFASVVARIWIPEPVAHAPGAAWIAAPTSSLVATLVLGVVGSWAGRRLKIPAGALLVPAFAGVVLQDTGLLTIELPHVVLTLAYAVLGWSVGLRFTSAVVAHAWRLLPRILLSMIGLIAICGTFAAVLTTAFQVDPLTAYLATSPGGIDSITIIAVSSRVDVSFVVAMQTGRLLAVLIGGPFISRALARRLSLHGADPMRS